MEEIKIVHHILMPVNQEQVEEMKHVIYEHVDSTDIIDHSDTNKYNYPEIVIRCTSSLFCDLVFWLQLEPVRDTWM